MATLDTSELLKNIEIFSGLDERQRSALSDLCEWISVRAGEQIYLVGEDRHDLYIVLSGQVRLVKDSTAGKSIVLDTLSEGAHFGENLLFSEEPTQFSAYSTTDVTLLQLSKDRLDTYRQQRPEID